jgi:uncharacterized membrane protein YgdD (TMEM256/DUF423 family)
MLSKQWVMVGSTFGFFGVVLGAFGAHALKDTLNERAFQVYQTAVHYQMMHALALIGLGLWATQNPGMDTQLAGLSFTVGTVLFSGSLYALAVTDLKFLGAIAPLGGLLFLAGWIAFAFLAYRA